MTIDLLSLEQLTPEIQQQLANLYLQLNPINKQRSLLEVLQPSNNVFVAICKDEEIIAGMALLSTYKVVSGYRGIVEDVVVDSAKRKKGIGKKLMNKLLEKASSIGLDEVLLFTGHHRKEAIGLYTSMGFEPRNSGVYNLKLY